MEPVMAAVATVARSTEADLVERAQRGDAQAFEALLRGRLDGLFRRAWAILGNEADARDATQEACLSAWRQLPRLRDVAAFDAWLARVLVNACRMHLRKRGRIREVAITPMVDPPAPSRAGPDAVDEIDAITSAFEQLDADARALLVMHHLQHRPLTEIAAALGIPVGTGKSRLHRARAALEAALAMDGAPR
jgi:RNA polymerase sigma-70 factor (ECF subfamily)